MHHSCFKVVTSEGKGRRESERQSNKNKQIERQRQRSWEREVIKKGERMEKGRGWEK